jgi:hypothetical protein
MLRACGFLLLLAWQAAIAGFFDFLDFAEIARKDVAEEIKLEAQRRGEPTGLFAAYWLMSPSELKKVCPHCEPNPVIPYQYRETRTIAGQDVAVGYKFKPEDEYDPTLTMIIVTPLMTGTTAEDLWGDYLSIRQWVQENVAALPEPTTEINHPEYDRVISSSAFFSFTHVQHALITKGSTTVQSLVLQKIPR